MIYKSDSWWSDIDEHFVRAYIYNEWAFAALIDSLAYT